MVESAVATTVAVAAGLQVVGITTTLKDNELRAAGAFMTIDDYDSQCLWQLVEGYGGRSDAL